MSAQAPEPELPDDGDPDAWKAAARRALNEGARQLASAFDREEDVDRLLARRGDQTRKSVASLRGTGAFFRRT